MSRYKKLTILHSNDMHGDFLAEKIDDGLIGGVSMLSGYVNKVRGEEENTIYCIAGDMFRGSVIDSEYKGISTVEIMNTLAPDVVTIGNHEADYGIAHLLFIEKCAKFPIINANLHLKTNGARLFRPHIVLEVGGMKILFIGIVTEGVMRQAKNEGLLGTFLDVHGAAQEVGRICDAYKASDIDLTVLLTHIGFEEDKKLAAQLDPAWGVDLIVGGHSHTFIDEPEVVNNISIVQAGTGTDCIGRFDLIIDTLNNCIESSEWHSVSINANNCPRDESIDRIIGSYKDETDKKYNRVITRFRRQLTHSVRTAETPLGNLFADILADSLSLDVMLLSSGSIREESLGPLVQYRNLTECFPYDEAVQMVSVTGRQLKEMAAYTLRKESLSGECAGFFQVSGRLKMVFNAAENDFEDISFDSEKIDDSALFRVGMLRYHYNNFERYFSVPLEEIAKNGAPRTVSTSARDILEEYLSVSQNTDKSVEGRIIIK